MKNEESQSMPEIEPREPVAHPQFPERLAGHNRAQTTTVLHGDSHPEGLPVSQSEPETVNVLIRPLRP